MKKYFKLFAYTLLLVHSLWMFRVAVPIVYYLFNQKEIASNLCVNKAKPTIKCNGKCYLKKQIAKTEESASQKNLKFDSKLCFEEVSSSIFNISTPNFNYLYTIDFSTVYFHLYFYTPQLAAPPPWAIV